MIEGGLYHVYNRFARGEEVFADPGEAIGFIDRLHETKARDGFSVLAWALMSNHFHLALRTSAVPLSRTMHTLQNGFSRNFNRRWRRTGPLWQSRYKAKLIQDQGYLVRIITYIHLNPVRAGLAEQPAGYVFSGHRELMGEIRPPLCDVDEALMVFGETAKVARRSYVSDLKQAMKEDGLGDKVDELPWWKRDRQLEVDPDLPYVDVLGRSTGLERQSLRAEQFITLACECLRVDPEDVASRRQDSATGRLRRLIASCGVERWDQRAGHLAAILKKHPVVVSRWVSEAGRIRLEDADFAAELESLDRALSTKAIERLEELKASEQQS
jgi:REP element-mobilizing transposase RayT